MTGRPVVLLPLGVLPGGPVATLSTPVEAGLLAFGLIPLLYLVTEELLVQAHEIEGRPWGGWRRWTTAWGEAHVRKAAQRAFLIAALLVFAFMALFCGLSSKP